ncbi:T9SS type A sorting domain-containing protein [Bacteroidia bacterium]|nr:T9SS type A sorting domain-containing protein [Bacteroidia bacterium]
MKTQKKINTRRQFLINTTLATVGFGLLPKLGEAKSEKTLADCDKTTLDYYGEGPFYTANPPEISNSKLAKDTEAGTKIIITGRVKNLDCTEFIPNTVIDVWHANDAGSYDNSGYNLRGKTKSNAQGFYTFETIKPGKYLNGAKYRPSHIHFKITPPGYPTITTQLYFEGDTDIPGDAAASVTTGTYDASHRIIKLTKNAAGNYEGTWDIVLDGKGITGINDLHINKGMIYKASPNPFKKKVCISYGVFEESNIELLVFDSAGKTVATLKKEKLGKEKYEADWKPQKGLPNGIYFIALKINDLQVHYTKVVKQG